MPDPDDQAQRITGQILGDEVGIERGSLGRVDAGWHIYVSCNEEIHSSLLVEHCVYEQSGTPITGYGQLLRRHCIRRSVRPW